MKVGGARDWYGAEADSTRTTSTEGIIAELSTGRLAIAELPTGTNPANVSASYKWQVSELCVMPALESEAEH